MLNFLDILSGYEHVCYKMFCKENLGCWWCLTLNMDIVFFYSVSVNVCVFGDVCVCVCLCVTVCIWWDFLWYHQVSVHKNSLLSCSKSNCCSLTLINTFMWHFFTYGKSKYPLPAFFYVLAELKMHLLPVANCEWRAFEGVGAVRGCMCKHAAITHIR